MCQGWSLCKASRVSGGSAGQWEAGEPCREGKRKPCGAGVGAAGDGVGVGAGGLELLWPQPLHFSGFRFMKNCWLQEGDMWPGPREAQGPPGATRCSKLASESPPPNPTPAPFAGKGIQSGQHGA